MKVLVKFICRYLFHGGVDFSFILHALSYKCDDRTRFVELVRDAKANLSFKAFDAWEEHFDFSPKGSQWYYNI